MEKQYAKVERKIRPYKTSCRKCETEEDVDDMLRLESDTINGNSSKKAPIILANKIENPEDIISKPERIAEQFIQQQEKILCGEKCRSRRINVMTYVIDEKKYAINIEDGVRMAQGLIDEYKEYSSLVAITENRGALRIDHIANNLCENGVRMTQVFNPATLYNCYKDIKQEEKI